MSRRCLASSWGGEVAWVKHHDHIVIRTGSGNSVIDSSTTDWDVGLIEVVQNAPHAVTDAA